MWTVILPASYRFINIVERLTIKLKILHFE
jgi:hypothetical protein